MKILTFISGFDGCGYYRAAVPSLALNKYPGVEARIQTTYNKQAIDWADIIIMQKQYKDDVWEWFKFIKDQNKILVYEADDDYTNLPEWNPTAKWFALYKNQWLKFIKASDAVIVSTEHLRQQFLQYNPKIFTLENGIDFDRVELLEKKNPLKKIYRVDKNYQKTEITPEEIIQSKKDGFVHIGWGGSPTHQKDLALIQNIEFLHEKLKIEKSIKTSKSFLFLFFLFFLSSS